MSSAFIPFPMTEQETQPQPPQPGGDEFGDTGADVRQVDPESIVSHGDAVRKLEAELAEWKQRHQRALADYQNLSRRSRENENEAQRQGVKDVASAMVTVLDHFEMALNQDMSRATPDQVRAGVVVIRDEIVRTLARFGLNVIQPKPGEPFDPLRHEAVMQAAAEGIEPNHVAQCFQTGYALGDRTLRPAKVSVST